MSPYKLFEADYGMNKLITAPDNTEVPGTSKTLFLAGAIDQGLAEDWQSALFNALPSVLKVTCFNPRRAYPKMETFGAPDLERQINWELTRIAQSDIVAFYIPAGARAPITLLELGLVLGTRIPCVIYCSPDFYRFQNVKQTVEFMTNKETRHFHTDSNEFFNDLILQVAKL